MNPAPSNADVLNAFEEYLLIICGFSPRTVANYAHNTRKLFVHLDNVSYMDVDEKTLRQMVQSIHNSDDLSAPSIQLMVSSWRKFFEFLKKRDFRNDNPATDLETPKRTKRLPKWVPEEEMRILLAACDEGRAEDLRLRAVVHLLYASGMRISELTDLHMADWLGRENGLLRVKGKGGKTRLVPLGKTAEEALETYIQRGRAALNPKGSDFIFPSPRYKNKPLTRQRMFQIIKAVAEPLGIEISAHGFRHSCATHMLEHGADLASVQTLLGHSMLQTTEIYTDVLDDALRRAVDESHPLSGHTPTTKEGK